MVSLKGGIAYQGGIVYKGGIEVSDEFNITPKEFLKIVSIYSYFTRYWDNAKGEYTDGRK